MSWLHRLRTRIGSRFWDRTVLSGGIPTWMGERVVRERINQRISGDKGVWPTDWLQSKVATPAGRGLSLGCGEGALERDLIVKGICREVVGIDASRVSLENARSRAADDGIGQIDYRIGDMNEPDLGTERFGAAFFHQSLHHVSDLDGCLRPIRGALEEGGWLYLDEYVGPSRRSWNRARIADARAVWETIPEELKTRRRLGYPIDRRDPTEAVRSDEILEAVSRHFAVVERRDYGGNLLAIIYPNLALDQLREDERELILESLLDLEDDLMARGAPSYYAVILAR